MSRTGLGSYHEKSRRALPVPWPLVGKRVIESVCGNTLLVDRSQTPAADPHGWRVTSRARAAEGLERASPFARRQRARARARRCAVINK